MKSLRQFLAPVKLCAPTLSDPSSTRYMFMEPEGSRMIFLFCCSPGCHQRHSGSSMHGSPAPSPSSSNSLPHLPLCLQTWAVPIFSIDSFYSLCQRRQEGFGHLFRGIVHKGVWERSEIRSYVWEGQGHSDQREGMVSFWGGRSSEVRKVYREV